MYENLVDGRALFVLNDNLNFWRNINRDTLYTIDIDKNLIKQHLETGNNTISTISFNPIEGIVYITTRDVNGTVLLRDEKQMTTEKMKRLIYDISRNTPFGKLDDV